MSIAILIYLADIADPMQKGLRAVGFTGFTVFSLTYLVIWSNRDLYNKPKPVFHKWLAIAMLAMAFAGLMYPSAEGLYKMAGVSAQEKASIDALGNVRP